jgi:hypothetical protein
VVSVKKLTIAGLAGTLLLAGALYFFEGQGRKIQKRFDQLSKWASKDAHENNLTAARKIKGIASLCTKNCRIDARIPSLSGNYTQEEISSLAAHARSRFSQLSLSFHDLHIAIRENEPAKANLTVRLSGILAGGEPAEDTFELMCRLTKPDGAWRFSSFEVTEILEK